MGPLANEMPGVGGGAKVREATWYKSRDFQLQGGSREPLVPRDPLPDGCVSLPT